jgi:glycine/D-amino acid oxidase-like deaminating enzyme
LCAHLTGENLRSSYAPASTLWKRLIFGGRARFSARVGQHSDEKSGAILRASLAHIFPHLADVGIDYCWGGLVDMTKDRFPRAGFMDGMHFAMGYSGHGTHMSVPMGTVMADIILGRGDRNPFRDIPWPALPLYSGTPWFLPAMGMWYRFPDRIR